MTCRFTHDFPKGHQKQEPHTKETWRDEFVARVANSFRARVVGAPVAGP